MENHITVGRADLPKLKGSIAKALPHMGHARTVEVLAAALGFKSYAALRAATANAPVNCLPLEHAEPVRAKLERFKDADPSASAACVARLMANLVRWERTARNGGEAAYLLAKGQLGTPEQFYGAAMMRKAIRDEGWTPESFAAHIAETLRDVGHDEEAGLRKLYEDMRADSIRSERAARAEG